MYDGTWVLVCGKCDDHELAQALKGVRVSTHGSAESAFGEARRWFGISDTDVADGDLRQVLDAQGQPVLIVKAAEDAGPLGDLMAAADPDERNLINNLQVRAGHKWLCPTCSNFNLRRQGRCPHCGTMHP